MLRDVRNELVSVAAARAGYGVVIDATTQTVDEAATSALRDELRRKRNWTDIPAVQR